MAAAIATRPQAVEHTATGVELTKLRDETKEVELWQNPDTSWTARCGSHTCTGSKEACVEWLGQHGHQPPKP